MSASTSARCSAGTVSLLAAEKLLAATDLVDLRTGVLVGWVAPARGASAKLLDPIAVDHDALAVDAVDSEHSAEL
jgi:hypothetical protein